ncbi:hypothetical protein Tco_0688562 [Tanacetum coccineum]
MGCQVVDNVPNLCGTFRYFSGVELIDASVGISYPFVFPYLDSEASWMLKGLFGSTSKSLWSENRWLGLREWGFISCLGIGKSFFIPFVVLTVKASGRV